MWGSEYEYPQLLIRFLSQFLDFCTAVSDVTGCTTMKFGFDFQHGQTVLSPTCVQTASGAGFYPNGKESAASSLLVTYIHDRG
jgi:hypothetical protein